MLSQFMEMLIKNTEKCHNQKNYASTLKMKCFIISHTENREKPGTQSLQYWLG